jgi:ElaB/YqjD/DUF883 family membrane-anchored ribosome-binding protein
MNDTSPVNNQVQGIENEARKLKGDLEKLLRQIGSISAGAPSSNSPEECSNDLNNQLDKVKKNLERLTRESEDMIKKLDKSVKSNPYVYILGAIGLGFLLGKAWRS